MILKFKINRYKAHSILLWALYQGNLAFGVVSGVASWENMRDVINYFLKKVLVLFD